MIRRPRSSTPFPYTTLFRSRAKTIDEYLAALSDDKRSALERLRKTIRSAAPKAEECISYQLPAFRLNGMLVAFGNRKSTRLNSSHSQISYAVFCLKKKNKHC